MAPALAQGSERLYPTRTPPSSANVRHEGSVMPDCVHASDDRCIPYGLDSVKIPLRVERRLDRFPRLSAAFTAGDLRRDEHDGLFLSTEEPHVSSFKGAGCCFDPQGGWRCGDILKCAPLPLERQMTARQGTQVTIVTILPS